MRRVTRMGGAAALSVTAIALSAGIALAGGWASATVGPSGEGPTAGEQTEVVITLLQHGVRPVDFGAVTVVATDPTTGAQTETAAVGRGNGEWVATIAFPTAGTWELTVAHPDLEISEVPPLEVAGAAPAGVSLAPITVAVATLAVLGLVLWAALRARPTPKVAHAGLVERAEG